MAFAGMNVLAIVIAAVAAWVAGAVWYRVFGNAKMVAERSGSDAAPATEQPRGLFVPLICALLAEGVMAWMLAGILGHLGPGQVTARNGVISGAFIWFGFVMTTMLVNNSFSGRSWRLLLIDGGHWLVVLLLMGAIVGAMGV